MRWIPFLLLLTDASMCLCQLYLFTIWSNFPVFFFSTHEMNECHTNMPRYCSRREYPNPFYIYPNFSDINAFLIVVERSSVFSFLVLVRSACQTCLESTCSSTSEWGLSDRDLWSINNDKSRRHSRLVLTGTSSHTHWCRHTHTHKCAEESWCVSVGPHCPFSEATVTKAACFFEKSSSPLSPVPHRKKCWRLCLSEDQSRSNLLCSPLLSEKRREEVGARSQACGITQKWTGQTEVGEGKTIKREASVLIS